MKVLKVGGIISSFFQLVLGIPSKLTLDAIDKSLEVFKVFLEESLEVRLRSQSNFLVAALMLGLSEADNAVKKCSNKAGMINPCDA